MTYLDTSALVKRFVLEKGSALVDDLHVNRVATAKIAYAEMYAALTRKKREGDLPPGDYALACRRFEEDWQAYIRLDLTDDILLLARNLIQRHLLRGYDAVHLASALNFKGSIETEVSFVAADDRLLRAARAEGLTAINVETAEAP